MAWHAFVVAVQRVQSYAPDAAASCSRCVTAIEIRDAVGGVFRIEVVVALTGDADVGIVRATLSAMGNTADNTCSVDWIEIVGRRSAVLAHS